MPVHKSPVPRPLNKQISFQQLSEDWRRQWRITDGRRKAVQDTQSCDGKCSVSQWCRRTRDVQHHTGGWPWTGTTAADKTEVVDSLSLADLSFRRFWLSCIYKLHLIEVQGLSVFRCRHLTMRSLSWIHWMKIRTKTARLSCSCCVTISRWLYFTVYLIWLSSSHYVPSGNGGILSLLLVWLSGFRNPDRYPKKPI